MIPRFENTVSETIFNLTTKWDLETWKDFRNNFCENYYEIRDQDKDLFKINFKWWKLGKIREYNKIRK